jgi:hypothetical protein
MKGQRLLGFIYGFVAALLVLIIGCSIFPSPSSKADRAEKKVTETKAKIVANSEKTVEAGRSYVFGAGEALSLNPQTNKYTAVAKEMISRAQTTLGEPSMADVVKMKAIIEHLLSENKAIVEKGRILLQDRDEDIINLQSQNQELNEILREKESKFVDISRINAKLADKWSRLVSIFWWFIWGIVIMVACKILGSVLPPPYNSIFGIFDYIIGGFIRMIFKLLPRAKETAKVVNADVQTALDHVVLSVQEAKDRVSARNETTGAKSVGITELNLALAKNTDNTTKAIITQTKAGLGYI